MQPTPKACSICRQYKPLDQFRPRTKDGRLRQPECRECFRAKSRLVCAQRRDKRIGHTVADFKRARNINTVAASLEAMLAALGGPAGLAVAWIKQLRQAEAQRSGSAYVLRQYRGFMDVLARLAEARRNQPGVEEMIFKTMTDEELQAAYDDRMAQVVEKNYKNPSRAT